MNQSSRRASISAFIVCQNEEQKIRRCLESVRFCDEILMIDSGSTDLTCAIGREMGAKIFERKWPGFVEQKRFGLNQCRSDWVLNLDADEEISPELRQEISNMLERDMRREVSENGFELHRLVYYLGRWWNKGGWYPEYRLRLMRRSAAAWGGTDPHEHALVDGAIGRLAGDLRHFSFDDISNHLRSINSHSSAAALALQQAGRRCRLTDLLFRPVVRGLKFFIVRRGYREGLPGLIASIFESFYVFTKYAKLWELQRKAK